LWKDESETIEPIDEYPTVYTILFPKRYISNKLSRVAFKK